MTFKALQELILFFFPSPYFSFLPLACFSNEYQQKFGLEVIPSGWIIMILEWEERGDYSANGFMGSLEKGLIEVAL